MMNTDWSAVASVIATLTAAVAAGGALFLNVRRSGGERRRTAVEADSDAVAAMRNLIAELNAARTELEVSRDQEEDCIGRLKERDQRIGSILAELAIAAKKTETLEKAMRARKIAAKIAARDATVTAVLDNCRDGIVLTSSRDGGTFEWVSQSFADALGYTPEEVLSIGWRRLCHPDDVEETLAVESAAIVEPGETRNRYRHRDGRWIALHWFYQAYDESDDTSICVVHFERRKTDPPWPVAEAQN